MINNSAEKQLSVLLNQYDYVVPPEAIAQSPADPRDSSKLLIFDRQKDQITFSQIKHLADFLPPHCVLVLNDTKVLPARLTLKKTTGGLVKILYIKTKDNNVVALSNKKLRPSETLSLIDNKTEPTPLFTVLAHPDKTYILEPHFPIAKLQPIFEQYGEMPLPPYIKHSPLTKNELKAKYQTVFAHTPGSIAAPTASLHFTPELLQQLQEQGIMLQYITLHVNLGTFAPLTAEQLASGKLHEEQYSISIETAAQLNQAKTDGRPIIAVGTTVTRALESAADENNVIQPGTGSTCIFIQPGYRFKFIDGLMTNFHVPRSSLLLLVAALIDQTKILDLYQQALRKKFRFFSFGDTMLIK